MRAIHVLVCLLAASSISLASPFARGETPDIREPHVLKGFQALDRPTGMAEAGFGWLTLPGA